MLSSGLGHASSFLGSDTIICIPGSRYFYNEPEDQVSVYSVNASEHSVSTTKIFTVGEQQMIADWLVDFPKGILSIVSDTFDLWKLITEYLPANKEAIMARDGKLVIRPDSGDPVDIICGTEDYTRSKLSYEDVKDMPAAHPSAKGVIELLWDIFGGTVNEQGYKVLDPHIGAIYGDSITLDRQIQIYERLEAKGFAATNIVLGVGSFTYQMNTRDTLGFAAKGAWFEVEEFISASDHEDIQPGLHKRGYDIYKDPITDDGTKKSLKGLICVTEDHEVLTQCTWEQEGQGILQTIYEEGRFDNQTSLTEVRNKLNSIN
jgi:nicotinamide phosphoribosyltransferase